MSLRDLLLNPHSRLPLALLICLGCLRASFGEEPKPMPQIEPGTNFATKPPEGWSNIVLFVEGRLASGDVSAASSRVHRYAKMFNLVILADIQKEERVFRLKKTGIGFTTKIKERNTVITVDTEEELGAELGVIARSVFQANEDSLNDIKRIVRSKNHVVFDAPTQILYKGEHELLMVRYLVWVAKTTGKVSTFVWLMDNPDGNAPFSCVEPAMQRLPENMREDRIMNVKGDKFNLLGIPAPDAFALVRIPQGTSIKFTPRLLKVAGLRSYDENSLVELLQAIAAAVQQSSTRREL